MKHFYRIVAMLLSLALIAGLPIRWSAFAHAEEVSQAQIYDLMTEDMTEPMGIDDPNPTFSWKMRSDVIGQRQTAYQLVVKQGDTVVWDTGKVESDSSVGIVYGGEALLSSTAYTWYVKVWDKDGKVATSEEAGFEMGLLEESDFADVHYISYQAAVPDSPSVYTIDFDFEITRRVIGFLFGAENSSEFLMWQFSGYWGQFRPHTNLSSISGQEVNICQTAEKEGFRILKGEGTKDEAADYANAGIVYHARIDVDGKVIKTYLGTSAEDMVLISTYTHNTVVYLQRMGFRQAVGESCMVDNLIVTDGQGKTYYENRFESADTNDISSASAVLNNGRLEVKSGAQVVLQQAGNEITNYTIDWDFEIYGRAASLLFSGKDTSNFLMWQFNSKAGVFKPHQCVNGSYKSLLTMKISQSSDSVYKILQGNGSNTTADDNANRGITYHARIQVTGATVKTWVAKAGEELQLISTYTYTSLIPLGKIGFRQGDGTEKAYYDNIVIKDKDGNVVYENKFDDAATNDLVGDGLKIENGRLFAEYALSTKGVVLQKDPEDQEKPNEKAVPAYRKSITVKEGLVSAKLYSAGLGVYESYINGQRVGRKQADGSVKYDELKSGFTQRNERQLYSTFDVTWMLSQGENVLGAMVTDGWWKGVGALHRGAETAYFAKLILTYADGTKEVFNTDTSWKAERYGTLQSSTGIYAGERYDATMDTGWMLPGYDDSAWPNVKINTEFTGELVAWIGVPVIVREDRERKPQSMTVYKGATGAVADESYGNITVLRSYNDGDTISLAAGETLLVDFGQNAAGWEYMEIEGARGTVVTVEHGEWLNEAGGNIARGNDGPGGSLFETSNRSITANTIYTMSGNGVEKYHPSYSFYGFQYIEITATAAITIHKLRAQTVTSVQSDTASMVTSDSDVNQLLSNITWGMYSNYLSIPTDCPQRNERHGWTGDAQVFSQAGTYLTYSKSFLVNYLQVLRDSQRKSDGAYPDIAPFVHVYADNTYGEVGWGDAGIVIPWYLYMMYGDTAVIRDHWASMRQYMDVFMASTDGNGSPLGAKDHLNLENSNKQPVGDLLGVAYYAWDALMMADMAEAIGETEAAAHYRAVYEQEKAIFQQRYVAEDGTLIRYEQTALIYALYLDLLPNEESVAAVTNQLLSSIAQYGDIMMTGFLGTAIITKTLTKIGRSDVAYTLLLQHNYPSWLYTVDQGATTMWERWNTYTEADGFGPAEMTSFNHYAYGAVVGWMYQTVAGIGFDEETPGFKNIVLAPAFDSRLPQVNSTYESAYGTIATSTSIAGSAITYRATIPANTTATAKIPLEEGQSLTVNGKALSALTLETDGIRYLQTAGGVAEFEAVAGSFTFAIDQSDAQTTVDWSNHYCQHCKKNVAWKPYVHTLSEVGHYYLAEDMDITTIATIPGGKVCLHLNGKTLTQISADRVFNLVGSTRELSIMDHPENQGKLMKTSSNTGRGAIFNVVEKAKLNIYGGTMTVAAGTSTGYAGILFGDKQAQIHMYGGLITGGNTTGYGGNICLKEGATFTLHGGTIENGKATGNGGNIYVESTPYTYSSKDYAGGASFIMHGGTVTGGSAAEGGNIYAKTTASTSIDLTATPAVITIDEDEGVSLITLGTAVKGGNISLVSANATVDAGTISYGYATGTTNGDGGGNVHLDANSSFRMDQDAGKETIITYGRSDSGNYGGNVHSYGAFTMDSGKVIRGYTTGQGANICSHQKTVTINGGFVGEAVRGTNVLVMSSGKLKLTDGTLNGQLMGKEKSRNVVVWDNGNVEISGGTLLGTYADEGGCLYANKGAILTITGGTFSGSEKSDVAIELVDEANVKRGTTLSITDANIQKLYVCDKSPDYDTTVSISGKAVIGQLHRAGTKGDPMITFALTEGASVTYSLEAEGEILGSGTGEQYIANENSDLMAAQEEGQLVWRAKPVAPLAFAAAAVVIYDDLGVDFKVDQGLLADNGYTDPYVVFSFGGVETTVEEYKEADGKLAFRFADIAPNQVGQTITATLYATRKGVLCQSQSITYSVQQYCQRMLSRYSGNAKLRTLLVDILNYGAAAQLYSDRSLGADQLVNAGLTEQQKAWATATTPAVSNEAAREEGQLQAPAVTCEGVGLHLQESVAIRFKLKTEDIQGLTVRFVMDGSTVEVSEFIPVEGEEGCYYVYFKNLNASQLRQTVKATVYRGQEAVSNTFCYSVECYVANNLDHSDMYLAELVKAVIRYGDAAYNCIH